jgi:hypothetical protein
MKIINNFVTSEELDVFDRQIIPAGRWRWGQRSNNNTLYPMWYQPYYTKGGWEEWVPQEVKQISYRFQNMYPGSKLTRAMLAGNTFGQDGDIHRDWQQSGQLTMVAYANKEWNIHWAGETIIYSPELEILNTVRPEPGKAVIFDSNLPHIGKDPARRSGALRCILAIQIELAK